MCAILPPRARHPGVDALLEHVEREGAGAEDLVVEGADVEAGAELTAGAAKFNRALRIPSQGLWKR